MEPQPLPYGTTPRLVMVHLSSEAIRTQNRRVELGDSIRQFLRTLGIQTNGGKRGGYTMFRKQMEALAACRLTIGMQSGGKVVTVDAKPIKRLRGVASERGTTTDAVAGSPGTIDRVLRNPGSARSPSRLPCPLSPQTLRTRP